MTSQLEFNIVSLKEVVMRGSADSVTLPTTSGEITVLPNHAALLSSLKAGSLRVKTGGKEQSLEISGGFMEVAPGSRLTVLLS